MRDLEGLSTIFDVVVPDYTVAEGTVAPTELQIGLDMEVQTILV